LLSKNDRPIWQFCVWLDWALIFTSRPLRVLRTKQPTHTFRKTVVESKHFLARTACSPAHPSAANAAQAIVAVRHGRSPHATAVNPALCAIDMTARTSEDRSFAAIVEDCSTHVKIR